MFFNIIYFKLIFKKFVRLNYYIYIYMHVYECAPIISLLYQMSSISFCWLALSYQPFYFFSCYFFHSIYWSKEGWTNCLQLLQPKLVKKKLLTMNIFWKKKRQWAKLMLEGRIKSARRIASSGWARFKREYNSARRLISLTKQGPSQLLRGSIQLMTFIEKKIITRI